MHDALAAQYCVQRKLYHADSHHPLATYKDIGEHPLRFLALIEQNVCAAKANNAKSN
jgi:hypothetical protein